MTRWFCLVFFQAEDGIRDLVRSRGFGDVYKRQERTLADSRRGEERGRHAREAEHEAIAGVDVDRRSCLLYTSDAADERSSVDLGGRRIIKKKTN